MKDLFIFGFFTLVLYLVLSFIGYELERLKDKLGGRKPDKTHYLRCSGLILLSIFVGIAYVYCFISVIIAFCECVRSLKEYVYA